MSFKTREVCEICEEQIKSNEAVLELRSGVARKRGFWRTFFGLFNQHNGMAFAHFHVNCLIHPDYRLDEPQISMRQIVDKLVNEEDLNE